MFGIGIPELVLILVVGLVVFGPSKLPEIGRAVGKGLREFRKASNAFQSILNAQDDTPARTMAVTHGGEVKLVAEKVSDNEKSAQTQKAEEKSAEEKEKTIDEQEFKEENKWQPPDMDIVKTAETVHGYTPPTKESVQAAIEANKEKNDNK